MPVRLTTGSGISFWRTSTQVADLSSTAILGHEVIPLFVFPVDPGYRFLEFLIRHSQIKVFLTGYQRPYGGLPVEVSFLEAIAVATVISVVVDL